jgi:hypothetical protein
VFFALTLPGQILAAGLFDRIEYTGYTKICRDIAWLVS